MFHILSNAKKGKYKGIIFIYFQFTELKVFERVNACTLSLFFFGLQGIQ